MPGFVRATLGKCVLERTSRRQILSCQEVGEGSGGIRTSLLTSFSFTDASTGHSLDKYTPPREQPHMLLLFQDKDTERPGGVKVVCYVEWEVM